MNKRYVLPNGDEIIDVSGVKPIEQISVEFTKPVEDLVLTPEAAAPVPTQEELQAAADAATQEQLIQDKMRSIAVDALISDGTLEMANGVPVITQAYKLNNIVKGVN